MKPQALITPWLLAVCCWTAHAGNATFTPLGDLPGGTFFSEAHAVSADGSVVVGVSNSSRGREEAFRWTRADGMVALGDLPGGTFQSVARNVSADGSVIVGYSDSASGDTAFRWTTNGGLENLGDLPGGDFQSEAFGVSADGSIVVGQSTSASGLEAFRWTPSTGMVGLGDLPGGVFSSSAESISADGSVIVGVGNLDLESFSTVDAFRWTGAAGMVRLSDETGQIAADDVSAEGSVIVGDRVSTSGVEAFRWTRGGGLVDLGDLPGGIFESHAWDVSGDGSVIVGNSVTASGLEAFRWTNDRGMQNLRDLLIANGATGLDGWTLVEPSSISADGRTIVGFGRNALGRGEGWIATLPVSGDFNDDGVLDIRDLDDLTNQSARGTNSIAYDLNADGLVNAGDITLWVKELSQGWVGDVNWDREFNSSDLVELFAAGTYEKDLAANWSTGDFDGNGRFDSSDLVAALTDGGYERGPRAATNAVPEPTTSLLFLLGALIVMLRR